MTNPPPPKRDHKITPGQARALMAKRPAGMPIRGGHFPREAIEAILNQPGCTGIRFYYGTNPDGSPAMVLVGIDENSTDMATGEIIDHHFPCPPFCGDGSALREE